jgi:hypothetical protein
MSEQTVMGEVSENMAQLPPPKDWAVLVYLGGENNLYDEMVFAIKEMKSSVPTRTLPGIPQPPSAFNFNALVQFAAEEPAYPSSALRTPRRFILKPGDTDGELCKDYDEPCVSYPGQAPRSYREESYKEELIDFLVWGIEKGRAEHYLIIFSGHGRGIESDFLSRDSIPPESLTVKAFAEILKHPRVKRALKEVNPTKHTIDILGLDTCLMSMAEVGYELRNDVDIMVSSQGSEANLGWPYKSIFTYLQNELQPQERENLPRQVDPQDLAREIVNRFALYYDDFAAAADASSDLAACQLQGEDDYMHRLKCEVDTLAEALAERIEDHMNVPYGDEEYRWDPAYDEFAKSLIFAHWYAQTYYYDQYVDLQDLCTLLEENLPRGEEFDYIRECCHRVIGAVEASVIAPAKRGYSGPLYQYSNGLSIYLPWGMVFKLYDYPPEGERLDFLRGGAWLKFVHQYIEFTRRPPRKPTEVSLTKYVEHKDSPPHSKGGDDPSERAKNPPTKWWVDKETIVIQ